MTKRERLLSSTVDCLTAALEIEDDPRLREARELVLCAVFERQPRRWWAFWRKDEAA